MKITATINNRTWSAVDGKNKPVSDWARATGWVLAKKPVHGGRARTVRKIWEGK